jgi:hypothetical protein
MRSTRTPRHGSEARRRVRLSRLFRWNLRPLWGDLSSVEMHPRKGAVMDAYGRMEARGKGLERVISTSHSWGRPSSGRSGSRREPRLHRNGELAGKGFGAEATFPSQCDEVLTSGGLNL